MNVAGCETDINTDTDHCGACQQSCAIDGATSTECSAGTCDVTFTLPVTDDSFTDNGDPSVNYGSQAMLYVGGNQLNTSVSYRAFLHATLPDIPSDAIVDSAELVTACIESGNTATALRVTSTWVEGTLDFDNEPSVDGTTLDTATMTNGSNATFDVADAVQAWIDGSATNYGIRLFSTGTNGSTIASSENGTSGNRPRFVITVTF